MIGIFAKTRFVSNRDTFTKTEPFFLYTIFCHLCAIIIQFCKLRMVFLHFIEVSVSVIWQNITLDVDYLRALFNMIQHWYISEKSRILINNHAYFRSLFFTNTTRNLLFSCTTCHNPGVFIIRQRMTKWDYVTYMHAHLHILTKMLHIDLTICMIIMIPTPTKLLPDTS
jgi:hypothetical protein